MNQTYSVDVHHVTRVEGHGSIHVNVNNGKIEKCEWQVVEAPRFFEAMIKGRHFSEVARITSRICGICAVGHTLASLKATEDAMGIEVTEQTHRLRDLTIHAENVDSHVVHLYMLAVPDLLGVPSVVPLASSKTDLVVGALNFKKLTSDWSSILAGRSTHPTALVPGGFSKLPEISELKEIKKRILDTLPYIDVTYNLLKGVAVSIPKFIRETEYIALVHDKQFGLYDGNIGSLMPDGKREIYDYHDYMKVTNEWVSPLSTAKYTKNKMDSYMVGALARVNVNFDKLHDEAKKMAEKLGFKAPCFNPYYNNIAQFIEIVHSLYDSIDIIDEFVSKGIKDEAPVEKIKSGQGVGAVEVPRGILFHDYTYDEHGMCTGGNCIIPTNQNHANIQLDMEKLVPRLVDEKRQPEEVELTLEMLVRAYDPCISCSTHYLDVKFVE